MNSGFSSYTPSGAPVEPVGQSGALIRVHDTVNRVSIGDGEVTEGTQAFDKGSTAELNPYRGTESVFATAMAPNGAPVTEILPDTLVTIGGTQAPVSFWVSEGLLQKAPDGTYVEGYVRLHYKINTDGHVRDIAIVALAGPQKFADNTEKAVKEILSLPIHGEMDLDAADKVCEAITEFYGKK